MNGTMQRVVFWAALAAVAGCDNWNMQSRNPAPVAPQAPPSEAAYLGRSAVRSDGSSADAASAVEAALALSDKQARLTDELLQAEQAKRDLEEANRKQAGDLAKAQTQLEAAQKELTEANQMLVEMRKEIDAWKASVLGFRDEIRKAQKAELDSLRKILVVLGAEVPPAAAASQPSTQPSDLQARAGS
jgi:hypothetical protein